MRVEFGFGIGFDRNNNPLPERQVATALRQILITASKLFGGCNLLPGQGAWVDATGNLVLEESRVLVVDIVAGNRIGGEFGLEEQEKINVLVRYIQTVLDQAAVHVTKLVATSCNASVLVG